MLINTYLLDKQYSKFDKVHYNSNYLKKYVQLHGIHLYSWPLHFPSERQSNSIGVSIWPFGKLCVTLHDGLNIVPGIDGFKQSTYFPSRVHLISKLSEVIGGHLPKNINKLNN